MNKITYCYHSHTYRCGHASGEDEEYIKSAIEAGFKEYGISDHVILPNVIHHNMRGEYSMLDGYVKSFKTLKEKYKDKINIHIGFEAEYMPEYLNYYKSLLDNHIVEYLILGQHCYYIPGTSVPQWYVTMEKERGLTEYTDYLIKGIESGLFTYVAHPDFFAIFYPEWDDLAISCSKKIINAAIKYNIPLEINLCKARAKYYGYIEKDYPSIYPIVNFWKLVAKTNIKVVIGIDSHNPKHNLLDNNQFVDSLIKETGLKIDFNYRINKK